MNLLELFESVEQNRSTNINSRVLLIDGLNTYIRVFATMPSLSDSGEQVGGILGTLRSIGMNIRDFNPSKCIIVFDGKGGSQRRKKIYPDYKGTRTGGNGMRKDIFSTVEEEKASMRRQMIRIVQYLSHLPVQIICLDNIEADDVIAYVTMQYLSTRDSKVRIVSTDRDFLQLVSDSVEVYSPVKKKLYTPDILNQEFKFHHNNYLLYRSLTGDQSDNIGGIKGIGLNTMMKCFPGLDEERDINYLIEVSKEKVTTTKKPLKVYQSILENVDILNRNYQLMQLQETDISGYSMQKIADLVAQPVQRMNRLEIKKMIAEDYLQTSFKNLDSWLDTTFSSLQVWAQ